MKIDYKIKIMNGINNDDANLQQQEEEEKQRLLKKEVEKIIAKSENYIQYSVNNSDSLLDDFDKTLEIISKSNGHIIHDPEIRMEVLQDVVTGKLSVEEGKVMLEDTDWLTATVLVELDGYAPKKEDINDNRIRDNQSYSIECEKLFPVGRIFSSKKQLLQTISEFSLPWGAIVTCTGSKVCCHYSKTTKVTSSHKAKTNDPNKIRNRKANKTKECTFEINLSFVDRPKKNYLPQIYYLVKITKANYHHTCELSPANQRIALKATGQFIRFDNKKLQLLLQLIDMKPNMSTKELRPFLVNVLPHYAGVDAQLVSNFLSRARKYIIEHEEIPEHINFTDYTYLATNSAANETIDIKDPFMLQNFRVMLKKIMREPNNTWSAINFLELTKEKVPGFDYRIKIGIDGPVAVMWMTPEHRINLIRYGDIFSIDGSDRQFNLYGWSYVTIALQDGENKLCLPTECINIEETNENYAWVFMMMKEIEPRFMLENIKIIFADQKVTTTLLKLLKIKESCILHGDYYHLMNLVWPGSFSIQLFNSIKTHLDNMICSHTKQQYDNAYESAFSQLQGYAKQMGILQTIYNNPKYYAGYVTYQIPGNLGIRGSSGAERNHSSIIAYNGCGATWEIAEQIQSLFDRQQNQQKIRKAAEEKYYAKWHNYENNNESGELKTSDEEAKKYLTEKGYSHFHSSFVKAKYLQKKVISDETEYHVWSTESTYEEATRIWIIKQSERCVCYRRRTFLIQCEHEFHLYNKFVIEKWNTRWLNSWTYEEMFPSHVIFSSNINENNPVLQRVVREICEQPGVNIAGEVSEEKEEDKNNDDAVEFVAGDVDEEEVIQSNKKDTALNYHTMRSTMEQLLRTINNDKKEMAKWKMLLDKSIRKYRNNEEVHLSFQEEAQNNNNDKPSNDIPKAITKTIANNKTSKRKRSSRESNMVKASKKNGYSKSNVGRSNDSAFLPLPKPSGRACPVCKLPGHRKFSPCPKLAKYGHLLPKGQEYRDNFLDDLSKENTFVDADINGKLLSKINSNVPNDAGGLVIHKRFKYNNKYVAVVTILDDEGNEREGFKELFFYTKSLARKITHGVESIVIYQMERLGNDTNKTNEMNTPVIAIPNADILLALSQQSNQSFDDYDQSKMGYGYM